MDGRRVDRCGLLVHLLDFIRQPAITRSLSDSFAGFRTADVLPFIGGQIAGSVLASAVANTVFPKHSPTA